MDFFKATTIPEIVMILSEPYVVVTERAYVPVIEIRPLNSTKSLLLRASAQSLFKGLEDLRDENEGTLVGLEIFIRRESEAKTASYLIDIR